MKIKKTTAVKASINCDNSPECSNGLLTEGTVCKYNDAICSIQCAIESLAAQAQGDQIAKDSIANLSVVLMDLKSNC